MGTRILLRLDDLRPKVEGVMRLVYASVSQLKNMVLLTWARKPETDISRHIGESGAEANGPNNLCKWRIPAFDKFRSTNEAAHATRAEVDPKSMPPVLVAAGNLRAGRPIVNYFSSLGFEAKFTLALEEAIETSKAAPDTWSVVAVEIDSFGGICAVVDDLLECRAAAPQLPVILFSESFSGNDLDEERLPLCDASLLNSSGSAMIMKGVKAAIQNNLSWRSRAQQLHG